jgi:hypothetical protein
VHLNFASELEFGDAAQVFAQDFCFDFELVLVGGVLVVASSAAAEVRTRGRDAVRRSLDDCRGVRPGEAGLFFGDCDLTFSPPSTKGMKTALPRPRSSAGRRASPSPP